MSKKLPTTTVYKASDGTFYEALADYQRAEIEIILKGEHSRDEMIGLLFTNREKLLEILSHKERKPRGKDKAPRAPRKALGKKLATPEVSQSAKAPEKGAV